MDTIAVMKQAREALIETSGHVANDTFVKDAAHLHGETVGVAYVKTAEDNIKSLAKYFVPASYQAILRALEHDDLTEVQLGEQIKADRTTVHKALGKMVEWKVVHVHDWKPPKTSGQWQKIYRLGPGSNKKMPVIKSAAQACRDYRETIKSQQPRDTSFAAMFGASK